MTTPPIEDSIEEQLSRLIVENRSEDGSIDISDQAAMRDELLALIESETSKARFKENAWSRQQMIAVQALEAPNSGFGRMVKWAINLFNKRKLELLGQTKEPNPPETKDINPTYRKIANDNMEDLLWKEPKEDI